MSADIAHEQYGAGVTGNDVHQLDKKSAYATTDAVGDGSPGGGSGIEGERTIDDVLEEKKSLFAYLKTRDFYIVLALGYVLAFASSFPKDDSCVHVSIHLDTSFPAPDSLTVYVL